jgi:hypothetical protein
MKWAYVKFGGGCGIALIPATLTVAEFKAALGLDPESWVHVPTGVFPLDEDARLFDHIADYDTVTVGWRGLIRSVMA